MGDETKIGWTDRTYNHWIGCTKVGPGCEHCYAEVWDARWNDGAHWGPGAPRRLTAAANRSKPFGWDRQAEATGKRWVFCSSLSDVFDNEVNPAWRTDLWAIIRQCRNLRWQITTKRIGNALKMLPRDWPEAFPHVGFLATVVTQAELDRDADKLLAVKAKGARWVGLSIEPQLEHIDLAPAIGLVHHHPSNVDSPALRALVRAARSRMGPTIDWVISGGESRQGGQEARVYDIQWGRSLRDQCARSGVPFFEKQLGSNAVESAEPTADDMPVVLPRPIKLRDRAGADPAEWPVDLRVREMPVVFDREVA